MMQSRMYPFAASSASLVLKEEKVASISRNTEEISNYFVQEENKIVLAEAGSDEIKRYGAPVTCSDKVIEKL